MDKQITQNVQRPCSASWLCGDTEAGKTQNRPMFAEMFEVLSFKTNVAIET